MNLSYVSASAATPLSAQTIGDCFAATVAAHPRVEALVSRHQGIRLSYAELAREVERAGLALLALGVQRGDRVGMWSPTCAEWTIVQLAAARVGAILVNVNPAYRSAELEYALRHSGVRVLVTARSFRASDYLAMITEVRPRLPALGRVIVLASETHGVAELTWRDFLDQGRCVTADRLSERERSLDADDAINIQYTSGTTGNPKGATLTHHNILNNARCIAEILRYDEESRVCIPVPLYHCFGMGIGNIGCIVAGATMIYPAATFDPLATLQAVAEERCTSLYGVPTMFIAELKHQERSRFDLSSLRTGVMGGSPCPIEVMRRVVDELCARDMCIAFGMTETSPITFMTRPEDGLERRVTTVGTVMPHVEAKIVDADGRTTPRGTPGEVCIRGYAVMRGYWNDPEATRKAIDEGGWMHTGDIGVLDEQGALNIVGRLKDMVIRGGENVYPREIEEILFQHPSVAAVQVVGVPDARMGEELMAWIIPCEEGALTADDARAFVRARAASFKVPRYVELAREFPLTVTGKVKKFRLRELAIERLGLEQAAAIRTA
jgi:fatty-acyl-CoA synthase